MAKKNSTASRRDRESEKEPVQFQNTVEEIDVVPRVSTGSDDSLIQMNSKQKSLGYAIAQAQSNREQLQSKRSSTGELPPDYLQKNETSRKAFELIHSKGWEYFFFALICVNAIEMGLALHYDDESEYEGIFFGLDILFAALFTIESAVTLVALGHHVLFNFWYALGLFCTCAAVGDVLYRVTELGTQYKMTSKFLKSIRLLMLGKLLRAHPETRLIVLSMIRSLAALRGVLIVIVVVCYGCTLGVYAVVGQKKDYMEQDIEFNEKTHDEYFGNIPRTMLTMFSVLILSEWENFVRPIYRIQPWFVLFFVCFTVLLSFGLMNVLVGIIVDTVNRIHLEHEDTIKARDLEKQKIALEMIVDMIFGDEIEIDQKTFLRHVENEPEILNILKRFHVPDHFTLEDLFTMLDDNKDGSIAKEELADGLFSFLSGNENARFCLLQLNISKSHADIVDLRQMISEMTGTETKRMKSQRRTGRTQTSKISGVNSTALANLGSRSFSSSSFMVDQASSNVTNVQTGRTSNSSTNAETNRVSNSNKAPADGDLWDQCYSSLHTVVEKHCQLEMDSAWEKLQTWYDTVRVQVNPKAGLLPGSANLSDQEHLLIWKKLQQAVHNASEIELRRAIDHAISAGIDSSRLALELTYKEALKQSRGKTLPVDEVQAAITRGDWSSSFDLVIDSALANGADKHILANVISRVSVDSSNIVSYTNDVSKLRPPTGSGRGEGSDNDTNASASGSTLWPMGDQINASPLPSLMSSEEPTVQGRAAGVRKFPAIRTKANTDTKASDMQAQVLSMLHTEASRHSSEQMSKAWEALTDSEDQRSFPLSQSEELFFIYNQMSSAVQKKSFYDLQRALTQAIVAGLDMRTLDVEVAYRDALARCYKDPATTIRLAVDAFRRKEWYLALDLLIQVSLARGADKQSLLRVLTKIFAETGQSFPSGQPK